MKVYRSIVVLIVSLFVLALAGCGQLTEDRTGLVFKTADPRLNIGVRLLPPPAPEIAPALTPEECLIKGNINVQGERIAHSPGQANYDNTIISPDKGERMFCTLEEAIAAGWRPSQR